MPHTPTKKKKKKKKEVLSCGFGMENEKNKRIERNRR